MTLIGKRKELEKLEQLFINGLLSKKIEHKQYFLEKIAKELDIQIEDFSYEKCINPNKNH